ncbi:hypothetical protein [Paludisphaera rhizosphaerae]|uniref:hypothetical protein n=1 Tax=Paludisphaera rhizosphaerae TaxID=2711216 RepID=UPI0013EBC335|nr:hypothetical protein [Paludisphaera rhizosphaerae]
MTGSIGTAALLTGTTFVVVLLLTLGTARGARKAGLPRWLAPSFAAVMMVWLGATALVGMSGVLSQWEARPPRWPLVPLTGLATFVGLGSTRASRRIIGEVPPWQPVALQSFRVAVELAFWGLYTEGFAPVQITFEGRNFDALVGLTAPLAAAGITSGWIGPRATIAWNVFGLAMLLNAIGTVATSVPGPLHLDWSGAPFTAIAAWPVVWVPAFLAPIGIFLHVVSFRQALAGLATRGGDPDAIEHRPANDDSR